MQSQPLPRSRLSQEKRDICRGLGARRSSNPVPLGWTLGPIRPRVAKEWERHPFLGVFIQPGPTRLGQGDPGMTWERLGCQSRSEADVTSILWGQMERSCRLLSQLPSLSGERLSICFSKKTEANGLQTPSPSTQQSSSPRPCLSWIQIPLGPLSLWRGLGQDFRVQTALAPSPCCAPEVPWCDEGPVSAAHHGVEPPPSLPQGPTRLHRGPDPLLGARDPGNKTEPTNTRTQSVQVVLGAPRAMRRQGLQGP